jgi:hypothetical protein
MKIWDNTKGEHYIIPKSFGKSIKPDGSDLQINFNTFFPISDSNLVQGTSNGELFYLSGGLPSQLLKKIIDLSIVPKIQKIYAYLSSFQWRIYGSSLLIVFEADLCTLNSALCLSEDDQNGFVQDFAVVKVIDFAHVQLSDSPDPGLLKGIQSTLNLFNQLSIQLSSI